MDIERRWASARRWWLVVGVSGALLVAAPARAQSEGASESESDRATESESASESESESESATESESESESESATESESESESAAEGDRLVPPALVYGVGVLGLVALGVGAYFGVSALFILDLEVARDPRFPRDVGSVQDSALAADALLMTGALFAIAAVVLAFFADWSDPEDEEEANDDDEGAPAEAEARVAPVFGDSLLGAVMEVSF